MNKLFLVMCLALLSCNSYNDEMNSLLSKKKTIENKIDSNSANDQKFRTITGYREIDDSLYIGKTYPHPELVDSIAFLKEEKIYLEKELQRIIYSIDSLQKLK